MVALQSAGRDQDIATSGEGVRDQQLQLPSLVPAGREPGAVVSLDPEAARWQSERGAEAIGPLQSCRQVSKHQISHEPSIA